MALRLLLFEPNAAIERQTDKGGRKHGLDNIMDDRNDWCL